MHRLRTIPGGWNPDGDGVIDIEQKPGNIIFLSAGDTELNCIVNSYKTLLEENDQIPSLRCVNLGCFKQELTTDNYVESVISHSKLVVARLLGGIDYYAYLIEQITETCEANNIPLLLLPGYNEPDPELLKHSIQADADTYHYVWNQLIAGGTQNTRNAISKLLSYYFAVDVDEVATEEVKDVFIYHPDHGNSDEIFQKLTDKPVIGIIGYRAHYLAQNLEPFDKLIAGLAKNNLQGICVLAHTLRSEASIREILEKLTNNGNVRPFCLINTTSFSTKSIKESSKQSGFSILNIPILQAMIASCTKETWQEGNFGLPPTDIAMSVALPEVDGRIITRALSFKSSFVRDESTDSDLSHYEANDEGIEYIVKLAKGYAAISQKKNEEKKIALILPNYPNKDARLANGVGLDTPQSVVEILDHLKRNGYHLEDTIPETSDELMDRLTANTTNDQDTLALKKSEITLPDSVFKKWLNTVSDSILQKITTKWGPPTSDPYYQDNQWLLSGFLLGNCWVAIQPSRGFNINPAESYHCPDLPPPWFYLAFYCYLSEELNANAVIHVGKHGNLEWLPGKSLALSQKSCFPAILLPPIPHFYPFIVNDPGEGTQAKRRNHAVIIDHMTPPLTRAETYGPLIELEHKIDEFYESCDLDPDRADLLNQQINDILDQTNLRTDLDIPSNNLDEILVKLDGYLCEIKEAQIRDGLHILGKIPPKDCLYDTLIALHRLPGSTEKGITQALAVDKNIPFDPINTPMETLLSELSFKKDNCRNVGQWIEQLETEAKRDLLEYLEKDKQPHHKPELLEVFKQIKQETLPKLHQTKNEITALMRGLQGEFIDSGPSGAPTRGRLDVLPTGRNFYSVDLRSIPTKAAWELGRKSADRIVQRYIQEHGEYPTTLSLSVWGTSTMRTGGDDIAQAFALMGVKPIWRGLNQRVADFEILPLVELNRPRVDVTLRISGFFRDAFPDVISLFSTAVRKVAEEIEPDNENPLRSRFITEQKEWENKGFSSRESKERALYRVFGSKPGSYGAGLQELINNRNWESKKDLADAYINWGSYAYVNQKQCQMVPDVFKVRLKETQIIMQNQDNREHDILDSDDYYQFHGGMTNAAEVYSNEKKTIYFGDHSRPESPKIKNLKEEILKVYRSRVINPKWIKGVQRHGYKGAFEMAATVDYLFAYDATTNVVEDFVYEGVVSCYLLDEKNRTFIEKHNPWALKDMAERMLEAIQRGLWKDPETTMINQLRNLVLESEGAVEDKLDA